MSALPSIRLTVTAFVYFTAISLGAGILVVNPARFLLIVPLITGAILLGHAVKSAYLNKLGYATMWLWTGVLALVVIGAVAEIVLQADVLPLAEIPVARVLGTFSLIAIVVAAYIHEKQRATIEGGQRSITT
ncbi:hypothetical protein [Halodesulfurarchaeum formicicum]|uniref:hypothetical protein n=1 Tax=Halodesulfurarchaeum formicicum TaxID=1873524 RepID=UPI000903E812|nr:hypothetical protein [Halodesulfurarchaeum formicicum]